MEQYIVTGMSCAACQARVEKAVSKVPGVTSVSVSLLTNSMGVDGSASEAEIISAVEAAGYGAGKKTAERSSASEMNFHAEEEALRDREVRAKINDLLRREMENTVEIIRQNKRRIDRMVDALMKKNKLTGAEMEALLKE